MKRTPLVRKTELKRTPLRRSGLSQTPPKINNATGTKRPRPLPFQSKKRAATAPTRRRLVAEVLAEHPWCCRCGRPATTLHEPQKRSRRPGSHLDRRLTVASCDADNMWAEAEPRAATAEQWLIPSWTPYEEAARVCAWWMNRTQDEARRSA